MGQLDILTYSSQIFWFSFGFFFIYYFVYFFLVPLIYCNLRLRYLFLSMLVCSGVLYIFFIYYFNLFFLCLYNIGCIISNSFIIGIDKFFLLSFLFSVSLFCFVNLFFQKFIFIGNFLSYLDW